MIFVTIFLSVTPDDPVLLDDIEHALLEGCDKLAGEVEASFSGVKVIGVQATK